MDSDQCICTQRVGYSKQCPNLKRVGSKYCGIHRSGKCDEFKINGKTNEKAKKEKVKEEKRQKLEDAFANEMKRRRLKVEEKEEKFHMEHPHISVEEKRLLDCLDFPPMTGMSYTKEHVLGNYSVKIRILEKCRDELIALIEEKDKKMDEEKDKKMDEEKDKKIDEEMDNVFQNGRVVEKKDDQDTKKKKSGKKKKSAKKKKEETRESISNERDRLLECLRLTVGEVYTDEEITERYEELVRYQPDRASVKIIKKCYKDYLSMDEISAPVASDII
jgi:hypothetical protein